MTHKNSSFAISNNLNCKLNKTLDTVAKWENSQQFQTTKQEHPQLKILGKTFLVKKFALKKCQIDNPCADRNAFYNISEHLNTFLKIIRFSNCFQVLKIILTPSELHSGLGLVVQWSNGTKFCRRASGPRSRPGRVTFHVFIWKYFETACWKWCNISSIRRGV